MVVKKVKKSPSRVRYDVEHPIASVRLTSKLKVALDELHGEYSYADILLVGLNKLKPKLSASYARGYSRAKSEFGVPFTCSVCGKTMLVTGAEGKKVCRNAMVEAGFGHASCSVGKSSRSFRFVPYS